MMKPAGSYLRGFLLSCSLLAAIVPTHTLGDDVYSGNHMYAPCGAKNNPNISNFTVAYVSGVLNTLQVVQGTPNFPRLACFPSGVTFEQARDIFCKYLDEHPEQRNRNSAVLAVAAFAQAFPCPKIQPPPP